MNHYNFSTMSSVDDIVKTTTPHWYDDILYKNSLWVVVCDTMILGLLSYLKEFTSVNTVTEDLMLQSYSITSFLLLFMSILVTGQTD